MNIFKIKNVNKQQGLTVLELVVVMFIFTLVSAIAIFNYSQYKTTVSLGNLSQDIALTIRKAQIYAISVKGSDINGSGKQFPGYGIHFYLSTTAGRVSDGSDHSFVFFSDIPFTFGMLGDGVYNQLLANCDNLMFGNECMNIINITSTDRIVELCADSVCVAPALSVSPSLDIVFTRPNPEPRFSFCINGTSCTTTSSYVQIKIQSVDGKQKIISVWNTGQIRID